MLRVLPCAVAVIAGTVGLASWQSRPEDVVRDLIGALNRGDVPAVTRLFTENGAWLPPDDPPATGREAVAEALPGWLRRVRSLDTLTVEVDAAGDLAVVHGRLTVSARNARLGVDISAGHYVARLRRVNGAWRITAFLFNLPIRPDVVG